MALLAAASFASCSDSNNITGTWETNTPSPVVPAIEGTVSAIQTTTFEFGKGDSKNTGPLKLTTVYEMSLPSDSVSEGGVSTVNATIEGTWTRDENDDDDYILAFDKNSLSVNAISAPELGPVTQTFLAGLSRFSKIEDVEISKSAGVLTFEDHADAKYVLSRK